MNWIEGVGYLAALITVATFWMPTMIPLRVVGIASNVTWIAYGILGSVYPPLVLHIVLLPVNIVRLKQMIDLIKRVRAATKDDFSVAWLKPFMNERRATAGEIIFRQGDVADDVLYTTSGRFRLRESNIELDAGQMVGELGLLAPGQRRTQTLECIEDGHLLTIAYEQLLQLLVQNPQFGFYFLRLTTARLFQNLAQLQAELARHQALSPQA